MKKISSWLSYLFVMVTAVCMIAIPSGCADEENFFLEESAARNIGTSNNRTPQDAQALAADAFRTFIDSTYVESRSGPIIDYSKPVVILRNPLSRSSESNDTLIYIVNYADDAGYAIIAAPKKVEPVLAVVHEGSFNEDLNDPSAHSPGFLMWLDNTMSIIGGGDLIDSIPNDDDLHAEPIPDLAQVKEYNETISCVDIKPLVRNSWGQGVPGIGLESLYPEGLYCDNGICGCVPLALAEIGIAFHRPNTIIDLEANTSINLNWAEISKHQHWRAYSTYMWQDRSWADCCENNVTTTHKQIAKLCHYIAEEAHATYYPKTDLELPHTGVTKDNTLKEAKKLFGSNYVSLNWKEFKQNVMPNNHSILLFVGDGKDNNGKDIHHAWICDGVYRVRYYHVLETKSNLSSQWTVTRTGPVDLTRLHFNWGWNGTDNGWFWHTPINLSKSTYNKFEYIVVSHS